MKLYVSAVLSLVSVYASMAVVADESTSLRTWLGAQPGGVVLAVIDIKGTQYFSEGVFSSTDKRPVDEFTHFEAGSISKIFTTLLLADAVRRGEVRLDEAIATRAGVEAPASVTFESLATHHSGLPALPRGFAPKNSADPYADLNIAKLWSALAQVELREQPQRFEYSNFGGAVLGQSLAKAIGSPYDELLSSRVLRPLHMESTVLDWHAIDHARLAPPHSGGARGNNWSFTAYAPAGGLVSTVFDLSRFVEVALGFHDSPLRASLLDCLDPRVETDKEDMLVGLGWMVKSVPGKASITWHNGGTGGYRSFVGLDRKSGVGVVLMTNNDTPLESLAFAILANEPYHAPIIAPPIPELVSYLGRYPLSRSFALDISAEGSQLFVKATGQPRLTLRNQSEDRFSITGVDAEIQFVRDKHKKVKALVLHQAGVDQRGFRHEP